MALDPYLQTVSHKVPILQVFAHRVRTGQLAYNGNSIRARSAEDYLRSVAQTFLGMGADDPRLNSAGDIDFRLKRMIAARKKKDPPPNRVKPVPVQVIRRISVLARHSSCNITIGVSDMIILAFFFLLRPGEYTDSPSDTTPFCLQDIQLFVGDRCLNLTTASDAQILAACFGALTFTDQKNGVRGEVVGLACSGDPYLCPVRAIGRRIIHLRRHAAPPNISTCTCMSTSVPLSSPPSLLPSSSMLFGQAITFLGPELGFNHQGRLCSLPSSCWCKCSTASKNRLERHPAHWSLALGRNAPIPTCPGSASHERLRSQNARSRAIYPHP